MKTLKALRTPEEVLRAAEEIETFAPRTIHESYRAFVSFFEGPLTQEQILQGAYMIYGWMPTMLRLKGAKEAVYSAVNDAKEGRLTEAALSACAKTLNNSLVGTTKLVHFANPEAYPIWDSRVYRALHGERPYVYRVENTGAYLEFLGWVKEMEQARGFANMKRRFETEAGYGVTSKRAAEAALYALGGKKKPSD